ncbi:hypothetical protein AWC31_13415 [Mycolicibacterium wolinskyi]|uniref:Uncharacterized protein n=1 Tax=Mycolicibacterium wolinskyi TaxID=59750 RepID=A0A1X2FIP4_9MYCO|nr:hypothetical protein AWC31_13415 [Mycolicibacterium wolinskyi]
MPSMAGISGLPGIEVNGEGELGTIKGVQTVVKTSDSSPGAHDADAAGVTPGSKDNAAAPATVAANPAPNSRRDVTPTV